MAVHGHYATMNFKLTVEETQTWWTKLHGIIEKEKPQFLVGDFNMSLPLVVPKLRQMGVKIDMCAWYPWIHTSLCEQGHYLGMDSMGMFYIGGDVVCEMPWTFNSVQELVRKTQRAGPQLREAQRYYRRFVGLDVYQEENKIPGKMWNCFKVHGSDKPGNDSQVWLDKKLEGMLKPSDVSNGGTLRLKQKFTDQDEWLVGAKVHGGAHFPLLLFTRNPESFRSKCAAQRLSLIHI